MAQGFINTSIQCVDVGKDWGFICGFVQKLNKSLLVFFAAGRAGCRVYAACRAFQLQVKLQVDAGWA